eukprot:11228261-Lingulodinium_polyedra.AAC.1
MGSSPAGGGSVVPLSRCACSGSLFTNAVGALVCRGAKRGSTGSAGGRRWRSGLARAARRAQWRARVGRRPL